MKNKELSNETTMCDFALYEKLKAEQEWLDTPWGYDEEVASPEHQAAEKHYVDMIETANNTAVAVWKDHMQSLQLRVDGNPIDPWELAFQYALLVKGLGFTGQLIPQQFCWEHLPSAECAKTYETYGWWEFCDVANFYKTSEEMYGECDETDESIK